LLFALAVCPPAATAATLYVGDVFKKLPPVMVYEFPDAGGRAEAVSFAQVVSKKLNPKAELIDAATAPEQLSQKLQNGFVFVTTLGEQSKLLQLATQGIGWSIEGGTFKWHDISTPAATVVLLFAVRNPYGSGPCLIIAGGSNLALTGFSASPSGSSSYYVYRGGTLLNEGSYDENFEIRNGVSKEEALADIEQFFSTLERVHPNLLAKVSQREYRQLRELTIRSATGKPDAKGRIAIDDLAYALYYAAAYFKDGHTSVQWIPDLADTPNKRFPAFRLAFDNGHFMIAAAKDSRLAGTELVAVNGTPVREFLRPILDRCSGETMVFRAARFLAQEPIWYYMTNLFGASAAYRLTVRDGAGEREAALETMSTEEYGRFRKSAGSLARPNQEGTKVEFLESDRVAHFMYSSFHLSDDEKRMVDQIFREVREKKSTDLIIDLRSNGGGNSNMGDYILSYLYDRPFRAFSKVEIKTDGKVTISYPVERAIPRPEAFFSGRVYLLIDNATFSSATDFAVMFRDYKIGTIVGYETGGLPTTFGDLSSFRLNNSGIPCGVSFKRFYGPKPRPGDDEHGVLPDVALSDKLLADFQGEKDPVLAYTLQYIRRVSAK
jgi:hypothetical protein